MQNRADCELPQYYWCTTLLDLIIIFMPAIKYSVTKHNNLVEIGEYDSLRTLVTFADVFFSRFRNHCFICFPVKKDAVDYI
jgi:uncharacterized SAM-dependent methyltransferase